ncbi:MAG TPA: hypothetical protein VFY63_14410 [Pseudorhizobium sp.]|nr:hypothetical protein [Pseudorhizobium sp.]
MSHHASSSFWKSYEALPEHVRKLADENFKLLKMAPRHPSLHFKRIGRFWSVRVGKSWRALALQDGDDFVWFWIGSHADYDHLIG